MLKSYIFHYLGVMKRKLTCTYYIIILEETTFEITHQESNTNVQACPDFISWLWDII